MELSELTAYAAREFHISEERRWTGIPGFSVLADPDSVNYAVSFNGKVRFNLEFPIDTPKEEIEKQVIAHENSAKWLDGKNIKKVIVVPGKLINIVVG